MAQTQLEGPAGPRLTSEQQQQLKILDNPKKAMAVSDMKLLAGNMVQTWNILTVLRGDKPDKNTPERAIYDKAVEMFGSADKARQELDKRFLEGVSSLKKNAKSAADVGDNIAPLQNILTHVLNNMNTQEYFDAYFPYRSFYADISFVSSLLGGSESGGIGTAVASKVSGASGASLSVLQDPGFYDFPGRIFRISTEKGKDVYGVVGEPTPEEAMSFGGMDIAQDFVGAYSQALVFKYQGAAQSKGCDELLDAMEAVQNQQMTSDVHYQNAMDYLKTNQRDKALDELKQIGPLSALYEYANNIVVVRIDQDALRIFTASATVVVDMFGKSEDWRQFWIQNGDKPMGRAVIQGALTFSYDLLKIQGRPETLGYGIEGEVESRGFGKTIEGRGHAITFTPELRFLTSAGAQPLVVRLYCGFGAMKYSFGTVELRPIAADGSTPFPSQYDDISQGWTPFLGVYGIEIQTPGRPADKSPVRFERVGIGGVGPDIYNAFAYATLSATVPVGDSSGTWRVLVTPSYSGVRSSLGEYSPRVGGEIDVADFAVKLPKNVEIYGGAPVRITKEFRGKDEEPAGVLLTPSVRLGVRPIPGLSIGGSVGYQFNPETGKASTTPAGLTVMANATFNIGEMMARSGATESGSFARTLPIPNDTMVMAQKQIDLAVDFVNNPVNVRDISAEKGQKMAKDLADLLNKSINLVGLSDSDNKHLDAGIQLLKAGKLKEGLTELSYMLAFEVRLSG